MSKKKMYTIFWEKILGDHQKNQERPSAYIIIPYFDICNHVVVPKGLAE